jgi:hypothetical protein
MNNILTKLDEEIIIFDTNKKIDKLPEKLIKNYKSNII